MLVSISRWVDLIETVILALLLSAMAAVTFAQVIARYVFNTGFQWALELVIYLFAALVLLGASHLMKRHEHLGVAAFVQLFAIPTQRRMGVMAVMACIIYSILLLWGSWGYVLRIYEIGIHTHDLGVSKWVPLSVLPIGLALLLIRTLQVGWNILSGKRNGVISDGEMKETIDNFKGKDV